MALLILVDDKNKTVGFTEVADAAEIYNIPLGGGTARPIKFSHPGGDDCSAKCVILKAQNSAINAENLLLRSELARMNANIDTFVGTLG